MAAYLASRFFSVRDVPIRHPKALLDAAKTMHDDADLKQKVFRMSAEAGCSTAMVELAFLLRGQAGLEPAPEATFWMERAASLDNAEAHVDRARFYSYGSTPSDAHRRIEHLGRAAQLGHGGAQRLLKNSLLELSSQEDRGNTDQDVRLIYQMGRAVFGNIRGNLLFGTMSSRSFLVPALAAEAVYAASTKRCKDAVFLWLLISSCSSCPTFLPPKDVRHLIAKRVWNEPWDFI